MIICSVFNDTTTGLGEIYTMKTENRRSCCNLFNFKVILRLRKIIWYEEEHHIITEGSILWEYETILNVQEANKRISKYIR